MAEDSSIQERNKALVQASFDNWRSGTGSPFDLLAPDAEWTIVGSSPLSATYCSKREFLDSVIHPFNARMATPLVPSVRGIYADGDMVIILFDGAATATDDVPYRNTYTWYFQIRETKVVNAIAFFDTRDFDDLWMRVKPTRTSLDSPPLSTHVEAMARSAEHAPASRKADGPSPRLEQHDCGRCEASSGGRRR
jgi:ketosteroid isomerase-like protein